jgi:hypothetical protein
MQVDFPAIPISDDMLWGEGTDFSPAYYWPFGELLVNFYKLARRNLLDWPITNPRQWKDLIIVKKTMADVFEKLSADDRVIIAEQYEWFLDKSQIIDWKAAAEYKQPTFECSGHSILQSLTALEAAKVF